MKPRLILFAALTAAAAGFVHPYRTMAVAPTQLTISCPIPTRTGWKLQSPTSVDHRKPVPTSNFDGDKDGTPAAPTGQPQEQCRYLLTMTDSMGDVSRTDLYFNLRLIPLGAELPNVRLEDRPGCGVSPDEEDPLRGFWTSSELSYAAVRAAVSGSWNSGVRDTVPEDPRNFYSVQDSNRAKVILDGHRSAVMEIVSALNAIGDTLARLCSPQAIRFTSSPPLATVVVRGAYQATATGGGSNNPVVFSTETPSTCTVSASGTATFIAAGTCVIAANQAAGDGYGAAATVTQRMTVRKAPGQIAFVTTPPTDRSVTTYRVTVRGSGSTTLPRIHVLGIRCAVGTVERDADGITFFAAVSRNPDSSNPANHQCTIEAVQEGDNNFFASIPRRQTWNWQKAPLEAR